MDRVSVYVQGLAHQNPIPAAARIGPFLFSSLVGAADAVTGVLPSGLDEQCESMFANIRLIMEAAGGGMGDVIKVTLWMADPDQRHVLNTVWLRAFPDPASRPARRTEARPLRQGLFIECEFVAVIATASS